MSSRSACFLLSLAFVLLLAPDQNAAAQYCIGHTAYIVRDEKGDVMTVPELKTLKVTVNGSELRWFRPDGSSDDQVYFQFEEVMNYNNRLQRFLRTGGVLGNPLGFGIDPPAFCGKIADLVINKGGKEMRLVFDIGEHNTHYEIDSLAFQPGTFYLQSTKCSDGAPPPMIDNNTVGKCFVSSSNWKRAEKNLKRYVSANEQWFTVNSTFDCKNKLAELINTPKQWKDLISKYPGLNNSNRVPAVDFKTELVLVRYFSSDRRDDVHGKLVVDNDGDLKFEGDQHQQAKYTGLNYCTIIAQSIYRSGIRSIDGKPVPAVSTKELTPLGPSPFQ